MNENSYRYFSNRDCQFFPCHQGADEENFNCLFCWCPLYALGADCGGDFTYTDRGIKDCSSCLFPHRGENYDAICDRFQELAEHMKGSD